MLRNMFDFMRGLVFGLLVGGSAGMLLAPAPGDATQSVLESRIEAARQAFHTGRAEAERELLAYFEEAKKPSPQQSPASEW